MIDIFEDGSFFLKKAIFEHYYSTKSIENKVSGMLGFGRRKAEEPLVQKHKDLAASLQKITNDLMVKIARHVKNCTGLDNLCLAGGVALNCTANSEIWRRSGFQNIFIQPAANDAGGALGAAYYVWHQILNNPRSFVMQHCYFGPSYTNEEIEKMLKEKNVAYTYLPDEILLPRVAKEIYCQKVIGWFSGRMEWGPRALGSRSILADPREKENWQKVNLKIKFRESFRPFAPSVLEEKVSPYFDLPFASPFMLFVAKVKQNNLPAVTHVDGTARVQTINKMHSPRYYKLIEEFEKISGCPVLINTSFNVRGEPIVCTPQDAFNTFIKTEMDFLVLENYLVSKVEAEKIYPF